MDYTLPPLPAGAIIPAREHSGNWASMLIAADGTLDKTSAEGAVIHIGDETGMFIYYTFEPNHFSRRFYIASFDLDGEPFPIYTSEYVQDPDTREYSFVEKEIGTAQLYFTGPKAGYLIMDTEETHLYAVGLKALQRTKDALSGPWVEDQESGNGYVFGVFDNGLFTVHTFYTHKSDEPWSGMYPKGNHTQEWEVGVAVPAGLNTWTVTLQRVTNGQRDNVLPVEYRDIETFTLEQTDQGFQIIRPRGVQVLQQTPIR